MCAKLSLLILLSVLTVIKADSMPPNRLGQYFFNLTRISGHKSSHGIQFRNNGGIKNDDQPIADIENFEDKFNKIYGGEYAAAGQFPFMAVIHRLAGDGKYFVCGGTILSKRWVLTAGHCVAQRPRKFMVVFGVVDKSGFGYDYITGEGVAMISNQGALHPRYSDEANDIALLYMPEEIPFSETIQPIRIAGKSYRLTSYTNEKAYVYGWGKDGNEGSSIKHLKYGQVPIVSASRCQSVWNVDDTHVCTDSSIGQDVCQGDSGGPLVVMEKNDEPLQIGIVSYGDINCPSDNPSVFTRVSAYATWIKRVTGIDYY